MVSKEHLMEQIERERTYLAEQEVGTKEYTESLNRLMSMERTLFEMEKSETETERKEIETWNEISLKQQEIEETKKHRIIGNVLEGIKVASGIILPFVGLVWITATEKESTFTGTLKDYTKYFLPKK